MPDAPTARRLLVLGLVAAAAGCRGTTEPGGCTRGQPAITVSPGDAPAFAWRPACRVSSVRVQDDEQGGPEVWSAGNVLGGGGDTIAPPVRYAGPPLVRGRRYRVTLESMRAASGCGLLTSCLPEPVGYVAFTP